MSHSQSLSLPRKFWIIAFVALIWNLLGVGAYLSEVTMSEEALAALPEAQRSLYEATPVWVTSAYAVAVFAGLLGAVSMVMKKNWAVPFYGLSLLAVLVQMGFIFMGMNAVAALGSSALIMPGVIIVAGLFFLLYSINAKAKGWLN